MSEKEQELERRVAELEAACEELQKTKRLLAARTAVAHVGMKSAAQLHSIHSSASVIRDALILLRQHLEARGMIDESCDEYLQMIQHGAIRILKAPDLPSSPLEAGAIKLVVNSLLRERVPRFLRRSLHEDVKIVWDLGPDEQLQVRADPQWLWNALIVLIENAVEAMTDSPNKILTIRTIVGENSVDIAVSDMGHVIDEQLRPRLFQEVITQPKSGTGAGVGLLMANTILQAYKGDIRLTDTQSSGTTFVISLPRAE